MNLKSLMIKHKGAALLLGTALLAGPVLAGQGRGPLADGPGRGGRFLRRAMAALDLSDDQKAKVKDILQSSRPAVQALHEQMRTDAKALHDAASAPNPDRAAVGDAFLKLRSDREAMKTQRQAVHDQIRAVLTPEQQAKLDGFLAGRGRGFGGHFRGMRGGPQAD